jgi:hypothetical protein
MTMRGGQFVLVPYPGQGECTSQLFRRAAVRGQLMQALVQGADGRTDCRTLRLISGLSPRKNRMSLKARDAL